MASAQKPRPTNHFRLNVGGKEAIGQFREDGVTIVEGLKAGDVVVTAGVHKLRAGQSVRLASARPQASADNTGN